MTGIETAHNYIQGVVSVTEGIYRTYIEGGGYYYTFSRTSVNTASDSYLYDCPGVYVAYFHDHFNFQSLRRYLLLF